MSDVTPKTTQSLLTLNSILQKIDGAYSKDTIRAYRSDFNEFIEYCELQDEMPLPGSPSIIANFIQHLIVKNRRSASIRRSIAGIASIHNLTGYEDPTKHIDVKLALRKMHRQLGRHSNQAQGITQPVLDKLMLATSQDLRGIRDRALLRVAYDTLCRRSELISIEIDDIRTFQTEFTQSTTIFLKRSKTDQESLGKWIHITQPTINAINEWLNASKLHDGYLFRGVWRGNHLTNQLAPGQVSRIFKRLAKSANIETAVINRISGHSTRIGAAQDLLIAGATLPQIMYKGRWSKPDTVMRYVENIGLPL